MNAIDKYKFLQTRQCSTLGWRLRHEHGRPLPTLAERARIEEGNEIHRRARTLYPGGMTPGSKRSTAAWETSVMMASPKVKTMFEATFETKGLVTRADMIHRTAGGWSVMEVKSRLGPAEDLYDDVAYTAMVMRLADIDVRAMSLLLVSPTYRLGQPDSDLFHEVDCTEEVLARIPQFEADIPRVKAAIDRTAMPRPGPLLMCRSCSFYEKCVGQGIEHHVLELPRLSPQKFELLKEQGIMRIDEIPSEFALTGSQAVVREAVCRDKSMVDKNRLRMLLEQVQWPAAYLDFETFTSAIPVYPGIAPHQQIPTQYSVHLCSGPGKIVEHFEYLADPTRDCRKELAEELCDALADAKSIVMYSSFEKRILRELAAAFPTLAPRLMACVEKLVDLEPAVKPGSYYHPSFNGRSSIKATLPVVVTNLSYKGLTIADGDTAIAMFGRMVSGGCTQKEAEAIRQDLLAYCSRDTEAMVRLHEELLKKVQE